jgi:hypothetical protein
MGFVASTEPCFAALVSIEDMNFAGGVVQSTFGVNCRTAAASLVGTAACSGSKIPEESLLEL